MNDTKQHMAICFDGISHGFVYVNLARSGNKGRCMGCKSIRCTHVREWNKALKSSIIVQEEKSNRLDDQENIVEDQNMVESNTTIKCSFPPTEATQNELRKIDGDTYDNLIHLVSEPFSGSTCIGHKNPWDMRCPITNNWVSRNFVRLAHSKFVKHQTRRMYYRPTTGMSKRLTDNILFLLFLLAVKFFVLFFGGSLKFCWGGVQFLIFFMAAKKKCF